MEKHPKILIVEDDPDMVESMRLVLESKSYQVVSSDSADDGLTKVRSEKPDLIILDVMMSEGTEGFHFAWKLRNDMEEEYQDIPILIVSAIHEKTEMRLYPEMSDPTYGPGEFLPVQGFIDKPVQPADLLEKVGNLLKK
ncbi:hypothetical protein HKBW3S42_01398 [Candidatus Hakubella thermalkaliphila]|uniref:Response regulatory domain-containing protein n=1 Tax=Candidatus Hakubella thermalkaliphila TaxID=2754717 RepID=A0A6V8PLR8_9ACTN|nr:hypothetical protein HKBW3S42_01398 [Candidatus Hakubella thermalkaliphila]